MKEFLIGLLNIYFILIVIIAIIMIYYTKRQVIYHNIKYLFNKSTIHYKIRLAIYQEMMYKYNSISNFSPEELKKDRTKFGLCLIYEKIDSRQGQADLNWVISDLPELKKNIIKHPQYIGYMGLGCYWFVNEIDPKGFIRYRTQVLESAIKDIKKKYKIK